MPRIVVTPAGPADYPAAARSLFSHLSEPVRTTRVARVLGMLATDAIDPAGLLVARDADEPGRPLGGVLFQFSPGNAAVVWPPRAEQGNGHVLAALAEAVVARLLAAGVKTAQTCLLPDERPAAVPLEGVGFRHVSRVDLYCRPVAPTDATAFDPAASPLTFEPVGVPDVAFGELLLATYEGSLDCPELNGVRTADEVLAGYAANGTGESRSWWRVRHGRDSVGVVLLTRSKPGILDLSYLGLTPTARGRGYGAVMLAFVLSQAAKAGVEWLNLSVDVRNEPALRLYRGQGFRSYEAQDVFLWRPIW